MGSPADLVSLGWWTLVSAWDLGSEPPHVQAWHSLSTLDRIDMRGESTTYSENDGR